MKNIFSLYLLLFTVITFAQIDSTKTNEKKLKTTSVGLFDPWRISINDKHELSTQPLLFFIIPNAKLKYQWYDKNNTTLFSKHSFTIPTLLLRSISREGTGGILPIESKIPFIFTTKHQFFVQKSFSEIHKLSIGFGGEMGFHGKNSDFPTIDFPIIFPRTHVYTNNFLVQGDFIWTIRFYKKITTCQDFKSHRKNTTNSCSVSSPKIILSEKRFLIDFHSTYFHLPTNFDNYRAFEESLILRRETYNKGYKLGVKYSYGTYPFGKGNGFFPFFDVIFKI